MERSAETEAPICAGCARSRHHHCAVQLPTKVPTVCGCFMRSPQLDEHRESAAQWSAGDAQRVLERIKGLVESAEAVKYRDEACRHAVAQPYADNRYMRLLDGIREALR